MRKEKSGPLLVAGLAFAVLAAALAGQPGAALAQTPPGPSAEGAPPASGAPGPDVQELPAPPAGTGSKPPPGVPSDASVMSLELTPRPVAYASASAEWANGFKAVLGEIAKVDAAIKKAGLAAAGHPFALFLETDEKNFQFEAMVPLAQKPEAKELSDGVKIGEVSRRKGDQIPPSRPLRRYRLDL